MDYRAPEISRQNATVTRQFRCPLGLRSTKVLDHLHSSLALLRREAKSLDKNVSPCVSDVMGCVRSIIDPARASSTSAANEPTPRHNCSGWIDRDPGIQVRVASGAGRRQISSSHALQVSEILVAGMGALNLRAEVAH